MRGFVPLTPSTHNIRHYDGAQGPSSTLSSSPFDDLVGGLFGNRDNNKKKKRSEIASESMDTDDMDQEDELSLSSFQQELTKRQQSKEEAASVTANPGDDEEEFSGYDLRDIIYTKYGECFDVQFQRVDSYGVRAVYLVSYLSCHNHIMLADDLQLQSFIIRIQEYNAI